MEKYIKERISLHKEADVGNTQPCTGKERWASGDTWAVRVKGRKKSLKNFPEEHLC